MISTLIVDDEPMFLQRLRHEIKWEHYGFRVTGEAKNGIEALKVIAERHVDLAVVDISMPLMDGLELVSRLKAEHPEIEIILVTAHSEFEYAKEAIKLGVSDYILKPLDKEELILTLIKVRQKYEARTKVRRLEASYRNGMKEMMLNALVLGTYDYENNSEWMDELGDYDIRFASDRFQVVTIEINPMGGRWEQAKERRLWKFAVRNVWEELCEGEVQSFTFYGEEDRIVSILVHGEGEDFDRNLYHKLCDLIHKYLKLSIVVGVGGVHEGIGQIGKSYRESLAALYNRFRLRHEEVIEYTELEPGDSDVGFYSLMLNEEIFVHLRMNEWDAIEDKLNAVKMHVVNNRLAMDYVYVLYMGFVSICLSYLDELGGKAEEVFGEPFHPYAEMQQKKTLESLHRWTLDLFRKVRECKPSEKLTKSRQIALAAKSLIDEHYGDPELTVESIAKQLYIHPGYLRAVFKKYAGMQISRYLLNVRMQRAKDLLKRKTFKITDIAQMVGYSDAGYFSKVFKKYHGVSPSEFESGC